MNAAHLGLKVWESGERRQWQETAVPVEVKNIVFFFFFFCRPLIGQVVLRCISETAQFLYSTCRFKGSFIRKKKWCAKRHPGVFYQLPGRPEPQWNITEMVCPALLLPPEAKKKAHGVTLDKFVSFKLKEEWARFWLPGCLGSFQGVRYDNEPLGIRTFFCWHPLVTVSECLPLGWMATVSEYLPLRWVSSETCQTEVQLGWTFLESATMRDSEAPEQPLLLSLSLFRLLKVIKPLTVLAPPPPFFFLG